MNKIYSISISFLYILSVFALSTHFINPSVPTLYFVAGGCCLLAALYILLHYRHSTFRIFLSEVIIIGFFAFSCIYCIWGGNLNLEWIITGVTLVLFYLLSRRISLNFEWLYAGLALIGMAQAIYGLGQYIHWFSNIAAPGFRLSGSFDNPAGFAATLTACFPFALLLLQKKELYWKVIGGFSVAAFIVAVVLSQSRAGIMGIVIISGIWLANTFPLKLLKSLNCRTKISGSILLIVGILAGLYLMKQDSANGRLLI